MCIAALGLRVFHSFCPFNFYRDQDRNFQLNCDWKLRWFIEVQEPPSNQYNDGRNPIFSGAVLWQLSKVGGLLRQRWKRWRPTKGWQRRGQEDPEQQPARCFLLNNHLTHSLSVENTKSVRQLVALGSDEQHIEQFSLQKTIGCLTV